MTHSMNHLRPIEEKGASPVSMWSAPQGEKGGKEQTHHTALWYTGFKGEGGLAEDVGVCWSTSPTTSCTLMSRSLGLMMNFVEMTALKRTGVVISPGVRGQMTRADTGFEQRRHLRHICLLWMLRSADTFLEHI